MCSTANHRPKGESRGIWIDSWTFVFIIEKPYERSLRGHDASRLWYGRKKQIPFQLEERGRLTITRINRAGCCYNPATLERNAYDYNSRWKLSLQRRYRNPRH